METKTTNPNEAIVALRAKTGAGMTDCKKALTEAGGDFQAAVDILRKKGLADAAKRSGRAAKEGVIAAWVSPDGRKAAVVELNCETDFVAKTGDFQALGRELAGKAAEGKLASPADAGAEVQALGAKVGENLSLRRFERFELPGPGVLFAYLHSTGAGAPAKKGALVELHAASDAAAKSEAASEAAKELALQVVGMGARWVRKEDVPPAVLAREKDIVMEQMKADQKMAGKPAEALAKIAEGKLGKRFFQENCLLEMLSQRDNKTPLARILSEASSKAGGALSVKRFARYQVGEE